MKQIFYLAALLAASPACSGGVDIGNHRSMDVPETAVSLSYPADWRGEVVGTRLEISGAQEAKLVAEHVSVPHHAEPTLVDLEAYVKSSPLAAQFKPVQLNAFSGYRRDEGRAGDIAYSELYVLSPRRDLIRVEMILPRAEREMGEAILNTIRIPYRGEALAGEVVHKARLLSLSAASQAGYVEKYIVSQDCVYRWRAASECAGGVRGVGLSLDYFWKANRLIVEAAGYDGGRIVDLGLEAGQFDEVRIEGAELVTPFTRVNVADIYTIFSPERPMAPGYMAELKVGHVYLIRTQSWPDEDMLIKLRVEELVDKQSVTFSYQKLAAVRPELLKAQVDAMNAHTLREEATRDAGEVTLFSRYSWGDYHSSTFNFEFGTRDNFYISGNSKDLFFNGPDDKNGSYSLSSVGVAGEHGFVRDLGHARSLSSVQLADFPAWSEWPLDSNARTEIQVGHVYLVAHSTRDRRIWAAVEVVEHEPGLHRWVRLKWRRLKLEKFQR